MPLNKEDRDLNYSRQFDVHTWSSYPEVNIFVDNIYESYFRTSSRVNNIKKKHLKKVLIDLYVAWFTDPELNISLYLTRNNYLATEGRYNELHISASTIEIVHRLREIEMIGLATGYPSGNYADSGLDIYAMITRIWSAEKLISLFETAKFGIFDITYLDSREVIILNKKRIVDPVTKKKKKAKPDSYPDTKKTREMRKLVKSYNALLEKTFIDINLELPKIIKDPKQSTRNQSTDKNNKPYIVNINHHEKFVKRVFSNSSWKDGGRFYGGFWQRITGDDREKILINSMRTVEIDYSALHVVLAYSEKNIDYWKMTDKDPYSTPVSNVYEAPKVSRVAVKLLFMMALNATDEQEAFSAFRNEWNYEKYNAYVTGAFTDEVLGEVLQGIRQEHPMINDLIGTGAGINLQYTDSQIAEYIIRSFTVRDYPVLTIHDSFVVAFGLDEELERVMKEAFCEVTGKQNVTLKFNRNMTKKWFREFLAKHGGPNVEKAILDSRKNVDADLISGYKLRWERHKKHYNE